MIKAIKIFIKQNPAALLLLFVYLYLIPMSLSYDHSWVLPEVFSYESVALNNGPTLQLNDLKTGLDWLGFELSPRITRPFTSYFEIIDTKFRCWLWQYVLPHPSLSLSWIFSLIITPLLLYRLLRNWLVSSNTAFAMMAFYLMTPAVMSFSVMLFHPAKAMTNFFILLCLYLASQLQKKFLDQDKNIPFLSYLFFWITSLLSFYWDETSCLILPALLLFSLKVFTKNKLYLVLWLCLPLITLLIFFKVIPFLTVQAGYYYPELIMYKENLRHVVNMPQEFLNCLLANAKNLIFDTMGILVPDILKASIGIKLSFAAAIIAWIILGIKLLKSKLKIGMEEIFLISLVLFFNYLMVITVGVWGPFYHGGYWSIFFVLWLGRRLDKTLISKYVLTACFFFISLSMFNSFVAINAIYKENHYYTSATIHIRDYFESKESFFDPYQKPSFSGDEIKWYIKAYWLTKKNNLKTVDLSQLPRELYWLVLELEPDKKHARSEARNKYVPTLILSFP